jgi:hypothetical protein
LWVFTQVSVRKGRTRGDRDLDLNNPVFQAVIGPFVVAFLVIGASRFVGRRTGSEVLAGLGVAAGLLLAFVQLRGAPSLPPNSAPEKLFYLIALAGLIGVALDLLGRPPVGRLAFVLFPAICLAWFSLRPLLAGPDVGLLIKLALMWAGAAIVLWQICVATARGGALAGAILIIATAIGAAGVAALAPFIGVTLLCAAVAAVAGAMALWAYGVRLLVGAPMTIGATSLLGAAGGLVAIVLLLVLFTASASMAGAALLIAVPFAGLVVERLLLGGGIGRRIFGPVVLAVIAAVPAAGAIGLAYLTPGQ